MNKKRTPRSRKPTMRDVVQLKDLAPSKPVVGGIGKLLFGERADPRADGGSAAEAERKGRRN